MKDEELDLSAFDEIDQTPDDELDLSAFDEAAQGPSFMERMLNTVTPSPETRQSADDILRPVAQTVLDGSKGVARSVTMEGLDELGGALGVGYEKALSTIPLADYIPYGIGKAIESTGLDKFLDGEGEYSSDYRFTEGDGNTPIEELPGLSPELKQKLKGQSIDIESPERSLSDTYRDYQSGIAQSLKESEERSPTVTLGGQLFGGMAGGKAITGAMGLGKAILGPKQLFDNVVKTQGLGKAALGLLRGTTETGSKTVNALAKGLKTYTEAAPFIGLEAGLASEEKLIGSDANPEAFAKDVAGGMAFGLPAAMGLQAVTDVVAPGARAGLQKTGKVISEAVDQSPIARQAKIAFEKYGKKANVSTLDETVRKEGIPNLHGGTPLNILAEKQAKTITDQVLNADTKLANLVGEALDNSNKIVNNNSVLTDVPRIVNDITSMFPDITADINFKRIIEKTEENISRATTPRQVNALIKDLTAQVKKLEGYKNSSKQDQELANVLFQIRNSLDSNLKKEVPEYARAANRLFSYRRNFIEQPIGGSYDPELNEVWFSNLKKGDLKLTKAYEDLVRNSQDVSQSGTSTGSRYSNLRVAAQNFENEELMRMQKGEISAERVAPSVKNLFKDIDNYADENMMLDSVKKTQESQSSAGLLKRLVFLGAETGRGGIYQGANITGRILSKDSRTGKAGIKLAEMGRNLYEAPAEALGELAQKLENNSATASMGKSLREGLESGDLGKRNAALFVIMQNPKARLFMEEEE